MVNRVDCAECGATLPDDAIHDPVSARTPCRNCGATARRFLGQVSLSGAASLSATAHGELTLTRAEAGVAEARGEAFDATVSTTPHAGTTRIAEYHLTVLADRSELGGLVVRLVDEANARDIAALYSSALGADDDLALQLAIDIVRLLNGPPTS